MTSDKADFTQGNILKKLVAFMMPVLGALILQAAYGAVDLLVVGRFGSTSGLSAVSTGSQILNLVTFVVIQFAMGITVLIARYLGEKRPEQIGSVIGGAAIVFTMISVVLFIVMVGFAHPISVLMQAPEEAVALTASYVRICGSGIFFIVAYNLLSAIFRGLGDSKSPLLFVLVACIVNVIGDLVLVAGLHMDAAGAAIATVSAQALSVVFAVVLLIKKKLPFTITKKDFRLNPQCRRFLKIGLPLALQEFLTQISFLALCAFVNRLGLEASSGYGVACKIVNFAMLVPSSLMQSMASFVSQNVGAGKPKRARKSMLTGIGVGLSVGCLVFILILLKGDVLAGFFSTDAGVIQKGFDYLTACYIWSRPAVIIKTPFHGKAAHDTVNLSALHQFFFLLPVDLDNVHLISHSFESFCSQFYIDSRRYTILIQINVWWIVVTAEGNNRPFGFFFRVICVFAPCQGDC